VSRNDAAVDDEQKRLLSRFGRRFTAGEVLYSDGDAASDAYLLQEGRVRLIKRVGAIERSLRVLRPGELFGESALMQGTPRNSTAVALESGVALTLDQATFQHVLGGNPAVGMRVLGQLIRRLRDAEDQIEILMVRDAQTKVVIALLKLAQQALGGAGTTGGTIMLAVSPIELAARVGLDVDTVKRNVQQLRQGDYVRVVDERVEIPDIGVLEELVGLLGVRDQILGVDPVPPRS
jgi:CRP/FNR family transcriptional regulator, cyclic AMP receptor protein